MRIWKSETLPSDLRDAVIVASQEETSQGVGTMGDKSLLSIAAKVLAWILSHRLSSVAGHGICSYINPGEMLRSIQRSRHDLYFI